MSTTSTSDWIVPPVAPSMAVYRRLRRSTGSLTRELMNLEIEGIALVGRVLDVGGGSRAAYVDRLQRSGEVVSVNLDADIEPTVLADLSAPLPFRDGAFDTVISFNTLEHLADDEFALREMVRVLAPNGRLHILVPFLYPVHGDPGDYHRHTAQGWNLLLNRVGVPDHCQSVRPIVWDPFSTGWAIVDGAPLGRTWWRARRFLRPIVLRRPLLTGSTDRRLLDPAAVVANYALAFSISAERPSRSASDAEHRASEEARHKAWHERDQEDR